jgi:hypothetical protein
MSTFEIDHEIDRLVDKFAEDLKARLKKVVIRSEKQMIKEYIASQKQTSQVVKESKKTKAKTSDGYARERRCQSSPREKKKTQPVYDSSGSESYSGSCSEYSD